MVDVFVHRMGLDTAAVEESCDLVQVVSDGGKLPCDGFDLVRVDIEYISSVLPSPQRPREHELHYKVAIYCSL